MIAEAFFSDVIQSCEEAKEWVRSISIGDRENNSCFIQIETFEGEKLVALFNSFGVCCKDQDNCPHCSIPFPTLHDYLTKHSMGYSIRYASELTMRIESLSETNE